MVEDEFLSTARLFTAHLHHAEYLRLKNEARKRNEGTINTISRPVDSITEMRAETRKKKEAEKQEGQDEGRGGEVGARRGRGKGEGSEGSESDFGEEEQYDDPWQGTQLQRFMTTGPKKPLTSLTGLQGAVLNTRAAAGLARAEKRTSEHEQSTPVKNIERRDWEARVVEDETEDEDSDDLDAPSYKRVIARAALSGGKTVSVPTRKAAEPPKSPVPKAKHPSPPRPAPRRAFLDVTPISKTTTTTLTSSKPPERPRPTPAPEPVIKRESSEDVNAARERLEARRKVKARREGAENERKKSSGGIGVDEIPVFLV
ncbi:hypothetical protein ABVK25_011311 [Lepraria finkii]|uniref:Uncharacterized protein n=1 Tax=Lepraria finkii TaxID=1340010 RepID=A0ABR4AQ23_9LECA